MVGRDVANRDDGMITIRNLGNWEMYRPEKPPADIPANVLFARRVQDQVDWYEFQRTLTGNDVYMTVMEMEPTHHVVQAATRDATALFPAHALLLSVQGIADSDPFEAYHGREYFPLTKTFGDKWVPLAAISDRQFFQALALWNVITKQEALDAVKTGALPAAMQAFVDAIVDPDERFNAQMLLSGATTFERNHPLVEPFGVAFGFTHDQIDDLWRVALKL